MSKEKETLKTNPNCPNKNCVGGVITFDGATGKTCKKCNPDKMKKIVTIRIEVDLESNAAKEYERSEDYFIEEVDTVLDTLSSINSREYSRYQSEEGQTSSGSKFKIVVKKVKTNAIH